MYYHKGVVNSNDSRKDDEYESLVNKEGLVANQTYKLISYMMFDAPKTVINAEKYFLIQDMAIEKYGVVTESEYLDDEIPDDERDR